MQPTTRVFCGPRQPTSPRKDLNQWSHRCPRDGLRDHPRAPFQARTGRRSQGLGRDCHRPPRLLTTSRSTMPNGGRARETRMVSRTPPDGRSGPSLTPSLAISPCTAMRTASHVHLGLATTCPTGEPGEYRLNWSKTIENAARLAPNAPEEFRDARLPAPARIVRNTTSGASTIWFPGKPPPSRARRMKSRSIRWTGRLPGKLAPSMPRSGPARPRSASALPKPAPLPRLRGRQRILDEAEAAQRNLDALNSAQVRAAVDRALSKARDKGSRER